MLRCLHQCGQPVRTATTMMAMTLLAPIHLVSEGSNPIIDKVRSSAWLAGLAVNAQLSERLSAASGNCDGPYEL